MPPTTHIRAAAEQSASKRISLVWDTVCITTIVLFKNKTTELSPKSTG